MNQQQAALIHRLGMSDADIPLLFPEAAPKWYPLIREWGAKGGDIEMNGSTYPNGWRGDPDPYFHAEYEYRLAPRTVTLSGPGGTFELPEPMRVAPVVGERYWFVRQQSPEAVDGFEWRGDGMDVRLFERNQIHATREAAEQWADALSKVMGVQS